MNDDDILFVEVEESGSSDVNVVDPNRSASVPMSSNIVIMFTALAITFLCAAVMYSSGSKREDIIMLFIVDTVCYFFGTTFVDKMNEKTTPRCE